MTAAAAVMLAGCATSSPGSTSPSPVPTDEVAAATPSRSAAAPPESAAPTARPTPKPTPAPTVPAADIVYLALGDSNVYGSPAECGTPCVTYPHLVADRITAETGKSVALLDGSQHNRLTAPVLLDEIRKDAWRPLLDYPVRTGGVTPRAAIAAADVITITLAANQIPWYQDPDSCGMVYDDACIASVEKPYIAAVDAILAEIEAIRAGRPTAVRITTFYNDLLKGPGYDPAWFEDAVTIAQAKKTARTFLDRWNADVCSTAAKHGAVCVDLYRAVNGPKGDQPLPAGWFSKDFGDLNQGGHTQVAEEIAKVGFEPLWAAP
jgi:hypothetical protein